MDTNTFRPDEQVDPKLVEELAGIQKLNTEAQSTGSFSSPMAAPTTKIAYAGFLRRVGAWIVDSFIINGIAGTAISWFMIGGSMPYYSLVGGLASAMRSSFSPWQMFQYSSYAYYDRSPLTLVGSFAPTIILWVYAAAMHSWRGQTLGKMIFRIKVTRIDGQLMSFVHALGREVAKLLSSAIFGLGYLWMLWDPKRRTWHDMLAKTFVIKITK